MSPGSTFLTPSVTSLLVSSPLPVEFRLGLAPGYFEASLIAKVASLTSARRSLRSSRISRTRRSSSRAIASDCGEWSITTAGEHTCALTWPEATELDGAAGTLTGRLREALGDVLENFSDACEHVSTTVWDHTGRLAFGWEIMSSMPAAGPRRQRCRSSAVLRRHQRAEAANAGRPSAGCGFESDGPTGSTGQGFGRCSPALAGGASARRPARVGLVFGAAGRPGR